MGVAVSSDARTRSLAITASDRVALMETIGGCTVMRPSEASEPVRIGPSQMLYIADGDATFQLGDRELQLSAGALVIVPRGVAHTVWNSWDRPAQGLLVISPGDAEHEFVPVETG
jgi:mannose-6-phosphate isomerase-like protein (cupin superfamily)